MEGDGTRLGARGIQSRERMFVHMEKMLKTFEKVIVVALLGLMMFAVFVTTVELVVIFFRELMKPPRLLLNIEEMLEVFGFFLMVLIGLELLESIKAYLVEDRVHNEVVFLVAIVAVSRKIIILDYKTITPEMLYGMAAVIVALGVGYFLVRRALHPNTPPQVSANQRLNSIRHNSHGGRDGGKPKPVHMARVGHS